MAAENRGSESTSRRDFLRTTCSVFAILGLSSGSVMIAGCDSGGSNEPQTLPDGVTRDGDTLTVDLIEFPDLQQANKSLWIPAADVIIINGGDVGYRAFSSVCPHEGEDVEIFESSGEDGYQLRCPAHDWTFDVDGDPTGRAQSGLSQFSLTEEGNTVRIMLDR